MNERIKELIKQSGGHWNYGDFNMGSSIEFQEEDIEKFAELIVRECANAADMAQDAGCEYAGDYVAEYMGYGVEEGVTAWRMK